MLMLTKANRKALQPLYAQDGKGNAAICPVKFFGIGSAGSWTWYALEFDGEDTFFGYVVNLSMEKKLGYFSLAELQSLKWFGVPAVERDRHFSPATIGEIRKEYNDEVDGEL